MVISTTPRRRGIGAISGTAAVALSFGVSELLSGLLGAPSLIQGVADRVVDSVPAGVKDWAIEAFGTNDKLVLITVIVVVGLGLGALVGVLARRRIEPAALAFAVFGILAALATSASPAAGSVAPWLVAIVSVSAGLIAFRWMQPPAASAVQPDQARRGFLQATSIGGLALLTAGIGRLIFSAGRAAASQQGDVSLPTTPRPTIPTAASFDDLAGITPVVVPNEDFYRIDTAIVVPRVDLADWTLSFTGMVDRPHTMTFDEVMELPMVERYITLSCVSNPVGGPLVGNARWLGVPLSDLLERTGVQAGAEQLVARSVDGFTVGFPIEAALDGREALLAVGMNGLALPIEHGFPARLVVSGLYGYVSATKWLSEIELTTWDGFDAYWVPRGWSKEAPIKTQSRIDTPVGRMDSGERFIAGVAWAPHRGISKVEVQIDNGEWTEAELSEPLSGDAWRQWRLSYDFVTGSHRIRVRATDGTGITQGEAPVPPAPNGAEGWHTVSVT
ncbi:MAG: molybdopterin-dependent oxidoreductase, partial [Acidimicrobiia bacterium]